MGDWGQPMCYYGRLEDPPLEDTNPQLEGKKLFLELYISYFTLITVI